jgi:LysR family glycine cleavage system transcriptional activator
MCCDATTGGRAAMTANRLPSLLGLRAFEAAARRLSFTEAALELHVSQAAVSRHVRALEQELGRPQRLGVFSSNG